jgi:hypothetical protein
MLELGAYCFAGYYKGYSSERFSLSPPLYVSLSPSLCVSLCASLSPSLCVSQVVSVSFPLILSMSIKGLFLVPPEAVPCWW